MQNISAPLAARIDALPERARLAARQLAWQGYDAVDAIKVVLDEGHKAGVMEARGLALAESLRDERQARTSEPYSQPEEDRIVSAAVIRASVAIPGRS